MPWAFRPQRPIDTGLTPALGCMRNCRPTIPRPEKSSGIAPFCGVTREEAAHCSVEASAMTEQAQDERAIFLAALEHAPGEERESFLHAACQEQTELLVRLRKLLAAHNDSVGPPDGPPPGLNPARTIIQPPAEHPGTQIGPYKLLEQIGEGGMGTVWMAQQSEPVKRLVALKVIKPGMDSRQIIARFEAERQALALMDHSNIARVLDAGTT